RRRVSVDTMTCMPNHAPSAVTPTAAISPNPMRRIRDRAMPCLRKKRAEFTVNRAVRDFVQSGEGDVMKMLKTFHAVSMPALPSAALLVASSASGDEINQRKENQQDRIAQGVKSGQLTAGETARLETKESALNQEERDMRKLDNGKLTAQDRRTINHQQNRLSRNIYRDKHNSRKQPH